MVLRLGRPVAAVDAFDHARLAGGLRSYEEIGEKFLQCANISAQVKAVAGILADHSERFAAASCHDARHEAFEPSGFDAAPGLSALGLSGVVSGSGKLPLSSGPVCVLEVVYCEKSTSRDILACLENFRNSPGISLVPYSSLSSLGAPAAPGFPAGESAVTPAEFAANGLARVFYPGLCADIDSAALPDGAPVREEIVIIGSSYPLYSDLFAYLAEHGVRVAHFEFGALFLDEALRIAPELPDAPGIAVRAARINGILKDLAAPGRAKVIHVFPKFSHFDIEDPYFSRNIDARYLSMDYAGGGVLSARDKIRLETFIKM